MILDNQVYSEDKIKFRIKSSDDDDEHNVKLKIIF